MPLTMQHVESHRARLRAAGAPYMAALAEAAGGAAAGAEAEAWAEFFLDDTDARRGVCLQEAGVDFGTGRGGAASVGEYRAVTVRNSTGVRQTAVATVPADGYAEQLAGAGEVRMTTLGPVLVPVETCFKVRAPRAGRRGDRGPAAAAWARGMAL